MSGKAKKGLWLGGAILALVALALPKIGALQDTTAKNNSAAAPRDPRLSVHLQVLQAEKLGDRLMTVGTVLANEEVEIRSESSGKVEKIFFKEGGRVQKGEALLKINDAELNAQLQRAQSRQAITEEQAERQRQLYAQKLASEQAYKNAENELNIAKAEVQLIQAQIDKTELRAPFAGTIGLRYVSEGSYISPTTRIATLQDYNVVKVDFTIPEKYAAAVKKGDKISFAVTGITKRFSGTVYALEPKVDPATRTLRLRASSPNPEGVLVPGAFANVEIVLQEKQTLTIPSFALIPELKGHRVFLYKNGKAESQSVTIGGRTDERVEIAEGLQAGDTLITSGILQLRPSMAVKIVEGE